MVLPFKRQLIHYLRNVAQSDFSVHQLTSVVQKDSKFYKILPYSLSLNDDSNKVNAIAKHISQDKGKPDFIQDCRVIENEEQIGSRLLFQIDSNFVIQNVIEEFKNNLENYGQNLCGERKNIIVEFSSPNIAKPFHVGHLRSTIIGNCISNVLSFCGHNVHRLNYLGDWGTQFGILSLAYDYFGDDRSLREDPLKHLLDVYIKGNAQCESDTNWREKAKERFSKLEHKQDNEIYKQWQQFRSLSIEKLKSLYSKLGVRFDEFHSESMYSQADLEIVSVLQNRGFLYSKKDSQALYAKLCRQKDGKLIEYEVPLTKSDGSSLYLTRDLAAIIHRKEQYKFDEMHYVVDNDQSKHFLHLKLLLEKMQYSWFDEINHIQFGRIIGLSTRKGEVVLLEDILEEAKLRQIERIKQASTTKVSSEEYESVASILAISGVFVNDLKRSRNANYKFDWDKALNMYGNTGGELQYSHARLCNLETNCGVELEKTCAINLDSLDLPQAHDLAFVMTQFEEAVLKVVRSHDPCFLVIYLFSLSNAINRAHHDMKVKDQPESIAKTRLLLFHCARNVLNQGLKLVGLKPLLKL